MTRTVGYVILAVAALIGLMLVDALKPASFEMAAFFTAWLMFPYAALALILAIPPQNRASMAADVVVVALVAAGGLLFLADTILLRPDPQGGIAVLFTPLYQLVGMAVLLPACRWLLRRIRA